MRNGLDDLWYSLRRLGRNPGFTAVAVLTLALGIGANTAIFSVVHSILLRPLPVSEPDRLVTLCETHPSVDPYCIASPPNVEDWSRQSRTFEGFGLGRHWPFALRTEDGVEGVTAGIATPGFFRVLRLAPQLGRLLQPDDLPPGNHRVVVLSDAMWRTRLGADPKIVGRSLTLDGLSYTVVGVLAPEARVPQMEDVELWAPLDFDPRDEENREWRGFTALGRLRDDVSLATAHNVMRTIAGRLAQAYPATNDGWGIDLVPLHERVVGGARPALLIFLGAVGFVLLIGCTNVANLLLARAAGRRRELAVRTALGAGRSRLVRLLLSESLLLSLAGGAAGLLLAMWAVDAFVALAPGDTPRLDEVAVDGRVLAFALLLSLATSVLSGLVPALHATLLDLNVAMKEGERRRDERSRLGLRRVLVFAEVALALVLLVGAALLTQSFASLLRWEPGFDQDHLLLVWLLDGSAESTGDQAVQLFEQAAAEVEALPGVAAVGAASAGPLFGGREPEEMRIAGRPVPPPGQAPIVRRFDVDPNYFRALGVARRRGRFFTPDDAKGSLPVAIINETMARRHWPGEDPLGERVEISDTTFTIVGVVADVRPFRPGTAVESELYWPQRQMPRLATWLVIRTETDPETLIRPAKARLREVSPDLQISAFSTMDQRVGRQLVRPRFEMVLLALFAGVALTLAAVGIYGVIAYSVAHRTREIGIRMALGARPWNVVGVVVGGGMVPVLAGVVAGLAGAFALARVLTSLLTDVRPTDPATFAVAALTLTAVAAVACYVPARRATRAAPTAALREE